MPNVSWSRPDFASVQKSDSTLKRVHRLLSWPEYDAASTMYLGTSLGNDNICALWNVQGFQKRSSKTR